MAPPSGRWPPTQRKPSSPDKKTNKYYKSTPLVNCGTRSVKLETEIKKEVPYLKCCVKDDQFGAGGNGVIAVVSLHEVGVDERVGICACRGH